MGHLDLNLRLKTQVMTRQNKSQTYTEIASGIIKVSKRKGDYYEYLLLPISLSFVTDCDVAFDKLGFYIW